MRHFQKQLCETEVLVSITCDLCGKHEEKEEFFLHVEKTFGYESVCFFDMDHLSMDVCEACLHRFLKENALLKRCITPYAAYTIQEMSPP